MPPFYNAPGIKPASTFSLDDGISRKDAGMHYSIIHTPGHTPGSVCIYFKESSVLFTGDTLFAGSVGRTDLPGGNTRNLQASLAKLARLPDDTRILPGHGPETTIRVEKATNFFMRSTSLID
jgi:hydroxyacylglutathione hydrolase